MTVVSVFGRRRMSKIEPQFELFFDGDCPLCKREIAIVRRMDRHDRVRFTDISDPEFDIHTTGKNFSQLMDEIHGRLSDGSWVVGVDAFRELYTAIGWWPLVLPTRLPGISHLLEIGYRWFAKRRLWLTGRCTDACHVTVSHRQSTEAAHADLKASGSST
jgi:predicted DCC family thiol-disulfide oxidoreductase YuxK